MNLPAQKLDPLERVPTDRPPFTVAQIKKAIPLHCFKRSIPRSFSYVAMDLTISAILYYASQFFYLFPAFVTPFLWVLYWVCQGCVLTGVWVQPMSAATMPSPITLPSTTPWARSSTLSFWFPTSRGSTAIGATTQTPAVSSGTRSSCRSPKRRLHGTPST